MLGDLRKITHLLQNAGQIKQNMQEMQVRLEQARYLGEAGAGQVRVTVNGKGDPTEIKFDPELITGGDVELLEDLTCAAVRDAMQKSREGVQKEMEAATGGMDLGGMMDMLGK